MTTNRDERWLHANNKRGMELAGRLAALKAGQDIRLEDMMDLNYQDHLFKLRAKEEKLRELLGVINHARERCQAGVLDRCAECGMALTETLLDERPWVLSCESCARNN